jgi:hypothetical protein
VIFTHKNYEWESSDNTQDEKQYHDCSNSEEHGTYCPMPKKNKHIYIGTVTPPIVLYKKFIQFYLRSIQDIHIFRTHELDPTKTKPEHTILSGTSVHSSIHIKNKKCRSNTKITFVEHAEKKCYFYRNKTKQITKCTYI